MARRRWSAVVLLLLGPTFVRQPLLRLKATGTDSSAARSSSGLALWLLENGAELNPRASVREDDGGSRGIWSTGDLERDAEVARVPWKLLLTRASAQDALSLSSDVGEYPSMALQLIHEKYMLASDSFWHSYLEMLPEIDDIGASFTWKDEDLELLSGSLIKNMSKFLREKIEEEYLSITKTVFAKNPDRFPADVFTLPRFLWAYAVLLSRAFRLRVNGKEEVIALVPWIDFMNHDPDSKAYVSATQEVRNGAMVLLKTDRSYKGNEQIFDSYGRRSNDELLLLYGFSLPRNVHNFVEISLLDLWSQTSLGQAKKTWLKVQGADVDEMQSLCLPRGYWPSEVMLLMRLLVLRPRDWKREGNLLQSLSDLGMKKAFDPKVEKRALLALRHLCEEVLHRCPEDLRKKDAKMMTDPAFESLTYKEKCAIMTRHGEVNVLETNLRRIDRLLKHIPFVFHKKEARRQQIFPGLAEDSKPKDFDIFMKEFAFDD